MLRALGCLLDEVGHLQFHFVGGSTGIGGYHNGRLDGKIRILQLAKPLIGHETADAETEDEKKDHAFVADRVRRNAHDRKAP
jgi:hypothetical protein